MKNSGHAVYRSWPAKKDLDEAELETVRESKNPTVVMTANGEVLAKEEATVYVRELDLIRDSDASRLYTGSSLTWKTLRRIWVQFPSDEWPQTTSSLQGIVTDMEVPATRRSESAREDLSARGNS